MYLKQLTLEYACSDVKITYIYYIYFGIYGFSEDFMVWSTNENDRLWDTALAYSSLAGQPRYQRHTLRSLSLLLHPKCALAYCCTMSVLLLLESLKN